MSKTTTTLFEIIKSELIKQGKNEFFNKENNNLVFFDDEFSFIKKIMSYDDDVSNIVNNKIFVNFVFSNIDLDDFFKRLFVFTFIKNEISSQTIESFIIDLLSITYKYKNYIEVVYNDYEKFLYSITENKNNSLSKSKMESNTNNESVIDNRNLTSDLPQDNVNLNVDDSVLNYANSNEISKNRNNDKSNQLSENEVNTINNADSITYNIDNLLKAKDLFKVVLNEYEKICFLHIF